MKHNPAESVDRLIELYCDWREQCREVNAAYRNFTAAPADARALAFAVYEAALDREESACEIYAAQVRLVERTLSPVAAAPVAA